MFFRYGIPQVFFDANAGDKGGTPPPPAKPTETPPAPKHTPEQMQREIARLRAENGRLKKGGSNNPNNPTKPTSEESVADRARREKDERRKTEDTGKQMERAIEFNKSVNEFIKVNADLLPEEMKDISRLIEKDNYDSQQQKSAVYKVEMIQSFFKVKDNEDMLTSHQKELLEDFKKLTKNGKEAEASKMYDLVFEPALEMSRRIKKTQEIHRARAGYATGSSADERYKNKLIEGANKRWFKNKG